MSNEAGDANHVSLLWAGPEHAAEIAEMHVTLFDPAWSAASVQKLLEHPGSSSLIGKHGFPKQSVGFILAQIAADEAEILSIGVIGPWQRKGLGMRLIEAASRSFKRASVSKVFLEVAADNDAALGLYRKAGFEQVGTRPGYYQRGDGAAVDALQLAKSI